MGCLSISTNGGNTYSLCIHIFLYTFIITIQIWQCKATNPPYLSLPNFSVVFCPGVFSFTRYLVQHLIFFFLWNFNHVCLNHLVYWSLFYSIAISCLYIPPILHIHYLEGLYLYIPMEPTICSHKLLSCLPYFFNVIVFSSLTGWFLMIPWYSCGWFVCSVIQ